MPSSICPKILLKRATGRKPIELDIMVREPDKSKLEAHSADARKQASSTSIMAHDPSESKPEARSADLCNGVKA